MTRRDSATVAAVAFNLAAGIILLKVLQDVALPAIAGLLVAYGIVR